jgi:hypothetical protein
MFANASYACRLVAAFPDAGVAELLVGAGHVHPDAHLQDGVMHRAGRGILCITNP